MQSGPKGKLFLVPAPLDFGCATQTPLGETMPAGTLAVAAKLTHWICENAKTARAFLKRVGELQPLAAPLSPQRPERTERRERHTARGPGFEIPLPLTPALRPARPTTPPVPMAMSDCRTW